MNIAINGFGRIGRAVFKALLEKSGEITPFGKGGAGDLNIVAINDLTDTRTLAHLLKYDSCYGLYSKKVSATDKALVVDGKEFKVIAEKEPLKLPWQNLKVDIVIESTGRFTKKEEAQLHIKAGAKKVIISAPGKGDVKTIVLSINERELKKNDKVFSMASCTTNCLAPVTAIIKENFGIKKAIMTTIHSYTADQNLVDGPHKDLRRARAAALNMVPTTTGAALATTEVIPELLGKFDGLSIRVPTPVVSISDIVYIISKPVSEDEINAVFVKQAGTARFKGIVTVSDEPLVSTDLVGNPASAIVDLSLTKVVDGDLLKVVAWYDNEWGYANRLADLCEFINKKGLL